MAGVVLAAGASTRMSRNKLLLAIEGESVLRRGEAMVLSWPAHAFSDLDVPEDY